MKHRGQPRRGVSLIESCVVVALIAIAVTIAAPSFGQARQRLEVEGVAGQLHADIQFTRSEAVARSSSLRISFGATAGGSCYVVHTGAAGDCRCGDDGQSQCAANADALKTVHLPAAGAVRLQSNVRSMLFDGVAGTVTPAGTVRVIAGDGSALHKVVSVLGRVRSCSPQRSIPAYRPC